MQTPDFALDAETRVARHGVAMDPIDHPAARVAASVSILLFSCLSNHAAAAEASGAGQFVVAGAAVVPEFDGSADGRLVPLVIANLDVLGTPSPGLACRASIWRAASPQR